MNIQTTASAPPIARPYDEHRSQIALILRAWGMSEADADTTAEILGYADLHGIDSHGMSMIPTYDRWRRDGRVEMKAAPAIVRETPISAVVDAGGGLGQVPARFAMSIAVEKAKKVGIGAVAVRNSSHFGACGYYSLMAAEAGLIGITTTTATGIRVPPTGGAEPRLGTDPWCFAAPGEDGKPFLLDMATTTVAYGRIRNKANEGLSAPPGWVLAPGGAPSTDPNDVVGRPGFQTSLGVSRESSSYKGYGLAMMVDILAGALSGVTMPSDPAHAPPGKPLNLGHFVMAIDPGLFRDPAEFRADVARFCDQMRDTPPMDPALPVQTAGDPERANAVRRLRDGVPVAAGLRAQVRATAEACGAEWILG